MSVRLTSAGSLNEIRTADPCGHICTHAGPCGRPRHRSHLVARSMSRPSAGLWNGTSTMLSHGQRLPQLWQPMHVSLLIVTSSVPSGRLIAPVGQPIMQTGSVQW